MHLHPTPILPLPRAGSPLSVSLVSPFSGLTAVPPPAWCGGGPAGFVWCALALQHMLDQARSLRPDLYVVADLTISSEEQQNLCVTRLSVTSFIRGKQPHHAYVFLNATFL